MMTEEERTKRRPEPPGRRFVLGWIAAVAAVLALTAGLVLGRERWIGRQTSELEREYRQGRRVLVIHALRGPRRRELELPATIHGYVETPVYAKVAGYLKRIDVDKGDRVRPGQTLAILDTPELDQQVANARANYRLQVLTDRRNQRLLKSGVIPQQAADESRAALLGARATLEQLSAMRQYKIIKAPLAGMIAARYVDPGTLIPQTTAPAAGTPIVTIVTLDPLRVYANVPQSAAPFIRDGDRAAITVAEYPGRRFPGAVTRHPEALNGASRTMRVEVDLSNPDHALLPGMYATADFIVPMPSGPPRAPDDALVFRRGKVFVPVVRNRRLHLAEVTLGYDDGLAVEAASGLADDDVIAIDVGQAAREGEPVQPVFLDPEGAATKNRPAMSRQSQ